MTKATNGQMRWSRSWSKPFPNCLIFLQCTSRAKDTTDTMVFRTLVQVVREGPFPLPEGGFPPSGMEIALQT
eukprot:scaffold55357_cov47-Attheya_sp.AAC.2